MCHPARARAAACRDRLRPRGARSRAHRSGIADRGIDPADTIRTARARAAAADPGSNFEVAAAPDGRARAGGA